MRAGLLLSCLIVLLTACGVVPDPDPVRQFTLPQNEIDFSGGPAIPVDLLIETPEASGAFAGRRIAVVPDEAEITTYRGARWIDDAPSLLRDHFVEAFIQQDRLDAVYGDEYRLAADYRLLSRLRAFESEYVDGEPQVEIALDVYLTGADGREVLASERFQVTEKSAETDIEAVVDSFGRAADRLTEQVVKWTTEQIAEARGFRPAPE
jgi:cholesterol transport system auxiliary component